MQQAREKSVPAQRVAASGAGSPAPRRSGGIDREQPEPGLSAWMWRCPDMERFVGSLADGRVDHAGCSILVVRHNPHGTLAVPKGAGSKAEWP